MLIKCIRQATYRSSILKDFNLLNHQVSSSIFSFQGTVNDYWYFSDTLLRIFVWVNLDLSSISILSDVFDHASTGSNDFGNIVGRYDNIKGKPWEIFIYWLIILIKPLTDFLDAFLNIFQRSLHCTDALIWLQYTVIVILITSHVNS